MFSKCCLVGVQDSPQCDKLFPTQSYPRKRGAIGPSSLHSRLWDLQSLGRLRAPREQSQAPVDTLLRSNLQLLWELLWPPSLAQPRVGLGCLCGNVGGGKARGAQGATLLPQRELRGT